MRSSSHNKRNQQLFHFLIPLLLLFSQLIDQNLILPKNLVILLDKFFAHGFQANLSSFQMSNIFLDSIGLWMIDCYFIQFLSISDFSFNSRKEIFSVSNKIGISIDIIALRLPHFVKPIHIELPNKRTEIVMFEIFWENCLGEFVHICYCECCALRGPIYVGIYSLVLLLLTFA